MSSTIQFWLSFNNGAERLRLPVNPESISIKTSQQFNDINVNQLGEYTVPGDANLTELEFNSFFPKDYNASYCEYENILDPWEYVNKLDKWQRSKRPCRLTVTGTPVNYAVTIRSFDYDVERAGNIGDIYYSITLKEYKFIQFRQTAVASISTNTPNNTEPQRPNPSTTPTSYTVVKGDSLSKIAAKMKSKGVKVAWQKIYESNKATIGKNPSKIYPGQKLVIPNG